MRERIVITADPQFRKLEKPLRLVVERTLFFLKKDKASVHIYLVGKNFMNKNVLAFPSSKGFPRPDMAKPFLGEIFLNPSYIRAHKESLPYMAVHGILHLLGYVHTKTHDRIRMERTEKKILKFLNGSDS